MRIINITNEKENAEFAEKAANHFRAHAQSFTYADGDPTAGELMAIRWNPFTVLIIQLSADFCPLLYPTAQFFPGDLPELTPKW